MIPRLVDIRNFFKKKGAQGNEVQPARQQEMEEELFCAIAVTAYESGQETAAAFTLPASSGR